MNCLGERIKKLRTELGFSQEKLAEQCDTTAGFIRHIEKSRRYPSYELLVKLCNTMKISPEYLLQDDLTFDLCSDDKNEIIQLLNKLTPKQINMVKDQLNSAKKYLVDDVS